MTYEKHWRVVNESQRSHLAQRNPIQKALKNCFKLDKGCRKCFNLGELKVYHSVLEA